MRLPLGNERSGQLRVGETHAELPARALQDSRAPVGILANFADEAASPSTRSSYGAIARALRPRSRILGAGSDPIGPCPLGAARSALDCASAEEHR